MTARDSRGADPPPSGDCVETAQEFGKLSPRSLIRPTASPHALLVWLWIAALMVIHTAIYANSASVVDTARDLYWAWSIARLEAFPVQGPALAHIVHLSPLWYYLLSVPLWFSGAWLGAALWAGLIAALQYPLAFVLGRRLAGPRCGVIFAGLCALPAWAMVSYLTVNHINAIEAATLFMLLCAVAWWQTRRPLWLVLLPPAVVLGVHAHPTVYVAALVACGILLVDLVRGRLPWRWLLLGSVLGGLPFVPYIVSQAAAGWPDVSAGGAYFSAQSPLANLAGTAALWRGAWIGGPLAAWRVILDFGTVGTLIAWLQILLLSTGVAITAWLALACRRARALLAVWVLAFLGVALIREFTPAYMTGTLYVISAGVAAYGLARLPPVRVALIVPPLVLAVILVRLTLISTDGDLKLPNQALVNIQRPDLTPGESFGYFPAWARGKLAALLCAEPGPVTVHGPASIVLEQSYALEVRMRCGKENLYLGGQVPGTHLIGVIGHDARALGLPAGREVGSLRLFEVTGVHHPAAPVEVPVGDVYPPRPYFTAPPVIHEVGVPVDPDGWLAVTNLYMVWMPAEVEVRLNGEIVAAARQTRSTHYFRCAGCAAGDAWQVTITAPAPAFVEVVTFGQPQAAGTGGG